MAAAAVQPQTSTPAGFTVGTRHSDPARNETEAAHARDPASPFLCSGYGSSDYAGGLAARRAGIIRVTILAEGVSAVLMILILPLAGLSAPSPAALAWGAAAGLGEATGALALFAGYRNAEFSVAGPLRAIGSAGFSVLAGLMFGERPGTLATIGTHSHCRPSLACPQARPHRPRWISPSRSRRHMGILAGASFALLFIGLNRAGAGSGLSPAAASQVSAVVAVTCLGAFFGEARLPRRNVSGLAALTGVTGAAGELLYFYATHAGMLAVTAVLTSLYPAVTILLARVLLGERLTAARLTGLCLAGASVGLIAAAGAG